MKSLSNMMDEESALLHDGRIVSEGNVSTALRYLAKFPGDVALATKDVADAKNALKRTWAEVYGEQKGPVDDKKAATDRDQRVVAARDRLSEEEFNLVAHQERAELAVMIKEVWQSENRMRREAESLR